MSHEINNGTTTMKRHGTTAVAMTFVILLQFASGCGENQKQNKDFYTSGNKEADERADQRMAQAEQLKGGSEGSGDLLAPSKKSLYDRLGGAQGLQAIADDFVVRAMADPRVNWNREGVVHGGLSIHHEHSMQWDASPENVKALKLHLAQFLALASGGPTIYQGREMKDAHADLHITNDEFDASVGDLKATLDKMQVANTEQKELLAIVETTRGQIVEER
jgi:hemoglobin